MPTLNRTIRRRAPRNKPRGETLTIQLTDREAHQLRFAAIIEGLPADPGTAARLVLLENAEATLEGRGFKAAWIDALFGSMRPAHRSARAAR